MMTQKAMAVFCIVMLVIGVVAIVLASIALNNSSNTGVLTPEQLVLLETLGNNTNITSSGCLSAKCFTDDYVAPNVPGTFFSTSEGNVTCQTLSTGSVASGSLDNTGILTIGDTNATAINIGQTSITTTVLGDFVSTVPFGSIYQHINQIVSISSAYAPVFYAQEIDEVGTLVEFETGDILQYKGTIPRTFNVSANLKYTMPSVLIGQVLQFSFGINGVPLSSFVVQDVVAGDLRWTTTFSDLVFLNPLDNINVIIRVSGTDLITIGGSMTIQAIN
jgi:hypothetical protein